MFKIPDQLSFEQASTLGVGVATCGQALCQLLGLPLPPSDVNSPNKTILIGGGSTATAVLGIQYAKLSGLRVIATASPYNFDYIESLGADAVLDYHEPTEDLVAKIKEATAAGGGDGSLTMAWDCSPNETFHKVAALAMSTTDAGIYATVDPMTPPDLLRDTNPMVQCKTQLAYTVFGEEFSLGPYTFPASREDVELHGAFWKRTLLLLGENKLHPTRVTVNRGGDGLSGVIIGLDELSQGKVAGSKLVYSL